MSLLQMFYFFMTSERGQTGPPSPMATPATAATSTMTRNPIDGGLRDQKWCSGVVPDVVFSQLCEGFGQADFGPGTHWGPKNTSNLLQPW